LSKVEYTAATVADGVEQAFKMLEGRWKLVILFHLFGGKLLRFSDLERAISGISQKMLIQQLRQMESDGIVRRIVPSGAAKGRIWPDRLGTGPMSGARCAAHLGRPTERHSRACTRLDVRFGEERSTFSTTGLGADRPQVSNQRLTAPDFCDWSRGLFRGWRRNVEVSPNRFRSFGRRRMVTKR
jgi:hypothetical protein